MRWRFFLAVAFYAFLFVMSYHLAASRALGYDLDRWGSVVTESLVVLAVTSICASVFDLSDRRPGVVYGSILAVVVLLLGAVMTTTYQWSFVQMGIVQQLPLVVCAALGFGVATWLKRRARA